jgi:hypothetical protein
MERISLVAFAIREVKKDQRIGTEKIGTRSIFSEAHNFQRNSFGPFGANLRNLSWGLYMKIDG